MSALLRVTAVGGGGSVLLLTGHPVEVDEDGIPGEPSERQVTIGGDHRMVAPVAEHLQAWLDGVADEPPYASYEPWQVLGAR